MSPSFYESIKDFDFQLLQHKLDASTEEDVALVLQKDRPHVSDLPVLLSKAAVHSLPSMIERASRLTRMRFGRVINLYAPLYLSNECTNPCEYCGFSSRHKVERRSLCLEEAVDNAKALKEDGFSHVLLVTGESPKKYGVEQIAAVAKAIGDMFHSISIEVFPMSQDEYGSLEAAGVDGLTLYQETYDPTVYAQVHPGGLKRDYQGRLDAPERGGQAGFRTIGIGALLGLADWRHEAYMLGLHAAFLAKKFWRSRIAVSFPRIVAAEGGFHVPHPVSDAELTHMMAALRLVLPDAEMVISTREPRKLRDDLVTLAVTRMSAGSTTSPGGYVTKDAGQQFSVVDDRSPSEIAQMLISRGLDPVWKDFDRALR